MQGSALQEINSTLFSVKESATYGCYLLLCNKLPKFSAVWNIYCVSVFCLRVSYKAEVKMSAGAVVSSESSVWGGSASRLIHKAMVGFSSLQAVGPTGHSNVAAHITEVWKPRQGRWAREREQNRRESFCKHNLRSDSPSHRMQRALPDCDMMCSAIMGIWIN